MQWIKALALLAATLAFANSSMAYDESPLQMPGPLGPLSATLLSARELAPVVILVPGSGATDRNGNNKASGLRPFTFKLLAERLADQGISSLRIDKRGVRDSAGAIADANQVTIDDYASDVRAWVTTLRKREPLVPVWLLGHSQGGLIAMLAAQDNPDINGVILAASAGRPLATIMIEQLQAHPENAPLVEPGIALIRRLEAGETIANGQIQEELKPLLRQEVQGLIRSEMVRDPAQLIATLKQPVLIIQGGQDLQITPVDARALQQGQATARLVLLERANHVFKDVPKSDRAANLAAYSDPRLPLAEGLAEAVGEFVLGH
ncbi:alpha/beta hydrolase [Pseudomonas rubra]|uniref:Lysophospholipase n=1 Tax=Pseudomonas rubra TaxID=2942627 RepID=A0ABT5PEX0_9PSED|nr:alpha/beta fold hydrolase [Pseudomonas rubra]MDD1016548.1 lysophospholipase [Pseudomonas rubra]MDD1039157.1 lysophospholipase [Pseudomonas rubra]MDD1157983.1 lysophospholipase [Pseudomonas rubra]